MRIQPGGAFAVEKRIRCVTEFPPRAARRPRRIVLTLVEPRATKPAVMSHNTFGHLFRVTTFGESHGVALGCVVDGCPPRIPLTAADIQPFLDQRRPGQ